MFQEIMVYESGISNTLSMEDVLRRTIEVFLSILGPSSVAMYLPGFGDDWQIGAYVNYGNNVSNEVFDLRLQGFADKIEYLKDGLGAIEYWTKGNIPDRFQPVDIGSGSLFADRNLLFIPCLVKGELITVITVFSKDPIDIKCNKKVIMAILEVYGKKIEALIKLDNRCKLISEKPDDDEYQLS